MAEQFCKTCGKKLGFFNKNSNSKDLCFDCFNEENLAKLDHGQPENQGNRLLKLMLAIIFAIIIGGFGAALDNYYLLQI